MATRTSIRPRPVDILRQLNIVRDVAELDKTDDLDAAQTQAPVAAFEQPPAGPQKKKKEVKEIPVPEVRIVPGYTREYLPLFRIPETYIRGKGGVGWAREDYCEYDLDNEDEDWLEVFNAGGANRLSEEKFEVMLWRLETANAEANQRLMSEPGYATDWRMLPAAVAATGNMSRDEALSVLRKYACARDPILHAVYDYWRGKRERLNKPIMRRLQAPTNPSDTNPYNVFRPRERVNRPQTRRRRENTQDCLDKMRQIRESMLKSLEMTELLTFREARKRDIHRLDVDMQRYQLARHHQPRPTQEAVEVEGAARLQETAARSRQGEGRLRAYLDSAASLGGGGASTSYDSPLRRALLRKRRRQELEGCVNAEAVARLPPPPLPPDDEMLVLFTPDVNPLLGGGGTPAGPSGSGSPAAAAAANGGGGGKPPLISLPPGLDLRCVRPRVGRCGRTMLTRCDPLTLRPHSPQPAPQPVSSSSVDMVTAAGLAARHPLLHSAQLPSTPWAACLDLDLLPEGIADKAALRAQRERRLNADRLNIASLRQTQQTLQQQAAGGMMGAASVAGAAAAAAAAAATAAATAAANAAAAAAAAPPPPPAAAPAGAAATPALTQRPPPPPAGAIQGAPTGTLPHIPQGAPSGTLPYVPPQAATAAPQSAATAAPPQAAPGQLGGAAGAPGSTPPQAPGSAGGQARKVPKVAGAAAPSVAAAAAGGAATPSGSAAAVAAGGAAAARSPAAGGALLASKQGAAAAAAAATGAGPGVSTLGGPAALAQAPPAAQPTSSQTAAGTPVAAATTPTLALAPAAAAPAPAAAAGTSMGGGATPAAAGGGGSSGAGAGGSPGTGPTVKKLLSASKAVAGPSSSSAAAQLKRGPGRPPKAAKATPNGDAPPPTNTTVPMDML